MGEPGPRSCGDHCALPDVTLSALGQEGGGEGKRSFLVVLLQRESFHLGQVKAPGLRLGRGQFGGVVCHQKDLCFVRVGYDRNLTNAKKVLGLSP